MISAALSDTSKIQDTLLRNKASSRRTDLVIRFAGMDITEYIIPDLLSLSYSDSSGDELDDLQIKLADRDGKWLRGWMNDAISKASVTSNQSVTIQTVAFRVTNAKGIKVRSGPGTDYSESGFLSFGSTVYVISKEGSWAKILLAGKEQYVSTSGIKEVPSEAGKPYDTTQRVSGMKISVMIIRRNWLGDGKDDVLDCGEFELDGLEASAPPSTVTIKATALPYRLNVRQTEKTKAWESYTLHGIAEEIANQSGIAFMDISVRSPKFIERVEQKDETDAAFLKRICDKYGVSLKFSTNIMILYDAGSIATDTVIFDGNSVESTRYKLSAGKARTEYQSCRVSYTSPKTGAVISGTAYIDGYDPEDPANTQLEIKANCATNADAQEYAEVRLRLANKYAKTVTLTVPGAIYVVAGGKAQIKNYGSWSGMYTVLSVEHSVDDGGFTSNITLSKDIETEPTYIAASSFSKPEGGGAIWQL